MEVQIEFSNAIVEATIHSKEFKVVQEDSN